MKNDLIMLHKTVVAKHHVLQGSMLAIYSQQRDIRPNFVVVNVAQLQAKVGPYQHVAKNTLRFEAARN